jgi:hypothetical protein
LPWSGTVKEVSKQGLYSVERNRILQFVSIICLTLRHSNVLHLTSYP